MTHTETEVISLRSLNQPKPAPCQQGPPTNLDASGMIMNKLGRLGGWD